MSVVAVFALLLNAGAAVGSPAPTARDAPRAPSMDGAPGAVGAMTAATPHAPVCPPLSCLGRALTDARLSTPAVLGSTATNWLVANWSGEGMISENPDNPLNLVAGGLFQYPSAMNNSTTYFAHGVSGAFTSMDGGRSWTDQNLPSYPGWFNESSPTCNEIHLADSAVAFGPNNLVYYIDLSDTLGNVVGCRVPTASLGLYSTVSTDGGRTWQTPVPIRGTVAGAFVDKPWIAVDPTTGEAYVAYTDDGNGSGIYLQNSTDGGASWSDPVELTATSATGLGVELAVDPWGGVDAAWMDASVPAIEFTRSTDHGATFSTPVSVASATPYPSSAPDGFRSYTLPAIGVDAYPGNAYTGDLYVVWQNGAGNSPGSPDVQLARSTDNGSRWSTSVTVNSDRNPEDFQPSIAIGPDGTVYVDWYAESHATGHYRFAAAVSHNGGASFDRQFNVSDVDSYPYTTATGSDWWIGDYTHTIADATGARPLWTDARSPLGWSCSPTSACLWGYVYNISFYTALLVNDSLAASVPTTLGVNGTVPFAGPTAVGPLPSPADWMAGDAYELTAPATSLWNSSSYQFSYWYGSRTGGGLLYATSTTLNGTVGGGEHFVACYALVTAGTCHAPGAPGFLRVVVSPSNASATLDGVALTSGTLGTTIPETPGTHWVNATATGYYASNVSFVVSPGNVTEAYVNLTEITGTLSGRVSPSSAQVTLNGLVVAVHTDGSFTATLVPGTYSVSATATHYLPFSDNAVVIRSGASTYLNITLVGVAGWINGTVYPASAAVTANGVAASVQADGTFSVRLAPGTYWINATLPGWSPESSGPVTIGPFGTASVSLRLTEYNGTIAGVTNAANATVVIGDQVVPVTTGTFRVDVSPGFYEVNVSAWSYSPLSLPVSVAANETLVLRATLNLSNGWITGKVLTLPATLTIDTNGLVLPPSGSFNVSLPAGSHTLLVTADGYNSVNESVTVEPGRATPVTIALVVVAPAGGGVPVYWAAVGVVAVVLVAVAILLIVRRRRRSAPPPESE